MAWTIEPSETSRRQFQKLDRQTAKRIGDFLKLRVAQAADPRWVGKAMSGPLAGYGRYRVGNYRIVCDIQDERVVVLVVTIGDRKDVYR